jgi:predicted nucleic acid-binding protein
VLTSIIPCGSELFHRGLSLFAARLDKEWSLTDCISFSVMKEHGLTDALTDDHHFMQAGFKVVL